MSENRKLPPSALKPRWWKRNMTNNAGMPSPASRVAQGSLEINAVGSMRIPFFLKRRQLDGQLLNTSRLPITMIYPVPSPGSAAPTAYRMNVAMTMTLFATGAMDDLQIVAIRVERS